MKKGIVYLLTAGMMMTACTHKSDTSVAQHKPDTSAVTTTVTDTIQPAAAVNNDVSATTDAVSTTKESVKSMHEYPHRSKPSIRVPKRASPEDKSKEVKKEPKPTVDNAGTTTAKVQDATIPETNTVKKTARLAYSFDSIQKNHEPQDITVVISVSQPASTLIDTLKLLTEQGDGINRSTLQNTKLGAMEVAFYKYITVYLVNGSDSQFAIKPLKGQSDRQPVDSSYNNIWQWSVTPNVDAKTASLKLIAIAEKTDGSTEILPAETIHIKIRIDDSKIPFSLWDWLIQHPEYVIGSILVPAFAFLIPWWLNRKKKNATS